MQCCINDALGRASTLRAGLPSSNKIWREVLLRHILLGLILLSLTGCQLRSLIHFSNPRFPCPSSNLVEPGQGYPYPFPVHPVQESTVAKSAVARIQDFCLRMERHFSTSAMSIEEAERLYSYLIKANGTFLPDGTLISFQNGPYGMPGPKEVEIFDFRRQMMVQKIAENRFEVLYNYTGPGLNYVHARVDIDSSGVTRFTVLEAWRESVPG